MRPFAPLLALLLASAIHAPAWAAGSPELSPETKQKLDEYWRLCRVKKKGPFSANMCVCKDGTKEVVRKVDGKLVTPCGGQFAWCESFRSGAGKALAEEGVYVGNLFKRDLYEWDTIADHHDLVRGYILEKYFIDTHPESQVREAAGSTRGLAGAEYEAEATRRSSSSATSTSDELPTSRAITCWPTSSSGASSCATTRDSIDKARSLASAIHGRARASSSPCATRSHNQINAGPDSPSSQAYREEAWPAGDPVRSGGRPR